MKKNNYLIFGAGLLLLAVFLAWQFVAKKPDAEESSQASSLASDRSKIPLKSKQYLAELNKDWNPELDADIDFLLEAFEGKDAELLRQRVQELLDKDWRKALKVFAELDYTFLHYKMTFPHDVVATHLESLHTGPEVMEILSAYINQSSILASVMGVYFEKWLGRDHEKQFKWFKDNTTFADARILANYVQAIGNSEKGLEVTRLLGQLPEEDQRKEWAYQKAMEFLASEQPAQFGEYLNELEFIPEHSAPAVFNLAQQLLSREATDAPLDSMEKAASWLNLVEDKELRMNYLSQVAAEFQHRNPQEFETWLSSVEFENQQQENTLLREVDRVLKAIKKIEAEEEGAEQVPEQQQELSPFSE